MVSHSCSTNYMQDTSTSDSNGDPKHSDAKQEMSQTVECALPLEGRQQNYSPAGPVAHALQNPTSNSTFCCRVQSPPPSASII